MDNWITWDLDWHVIENMSWEHLDLVLHFIENSGVAIYMWQRSHLALAFCRKTIILSRGVDPDPYPQPSRCTFNPAKETTGCSQARIPSRFQAHQKCTRWFCGLGKTDALYRPLECIQRFGGEATRVPQVLWMFFGSGQAGQSPKIP